MKIYDYSGDIFGELSLIQTHDIIEIKNARVCVLGGHCVSISALSYLFSSLDSFNSLYVLTDKQILKLKKHFEKRKHRLGED